MRARRAIAGSLTAAALSAGLLAGGIPGAGGHPSVTPRQQPRAGSKAGDGHGGFRASKVGSFASPTFVTGPRGAGGKLFVVEQEGVIESLAKGGKGKPQKFLDIRNKVEAGGERGLLSVAFSPGYGHNGLFYVYYTRPGGDIVIAEYRRAGKHGSHADGRSGRRVITIEHSANANHNGGQLQFGPDGLLYIGTGDGGSGYDPPENAQNKRVLLGKLLRIDPRRKGKKPYSVPRSNPFVGRDGENEIYSFGLRNPFRFSFDRRSNALVIGDVGQERYEEVDYETLKSARGANFGWDAFEGDHPVDTDPSPPPADPVFPIFEYSHSDGNCSITGGYVSRDRRIRSLWGRYLYADYCKGQVRSLIPSRKRARGDSKTGLPSTSGVSSFGEDSKGHLYYANVSSGEVFAIEPKRKKR
jgi:glucose/arabinose dehydrogenase